MGRHSRAERQYEYLQNHGETSKITLLLRLGRSITNLLHRKIEDINSYCGSTSKNK